MLPVTHAIGWSELGTKMNTLLHTKSSVLLIGKNSFLGHAFLTMANGVHRVDGVGHDVDLASVKFADYDVVVNMAYDPRYMREGYQVSQDFDLAVAQAVARCGASQPHLILMSTRRVYGSNSPFPASETAPLQPMGVYAENKIITEAAVADLLGDRLTILRLSNVFGFEPGRHTFMGIALAHLKAHDSIVLDINPNVERDFLPVGNFVQTLTRIVTAAPPGLYNLGSDTATPVGQVARWVIEGFGRGKLQVTDNTERDRFRLDCQKLRGVIGDFTTGIDIRLSSIEIGKRLQHA